MPNPVAGLVGANVVTGLISGRQERKAGQRAAEIQAGAAQAGIEEQRRQFDLIQELLKPYVEAGTGALGAQQALLGLGGPQAQQAAISGLEQSPILQALTQQGENAILQNAAATGGLRGGNIQSALAQFRPQMLSNLIQQQFQNLGGLTNVGQASAAGVGSAGQAAGANISNLLQQGGAARAGGVLAAQQARSGMLNLIPQAIGTYGGLRGLF